MANKTSKPPKFHHYVPRTYLKHWLDKEELLYIYNKKSNTVSPSSIKGQYFGNNHLNTITYPDNTKGYWVEKEFANIEGTISPTLNKLAATTHKTSNRITYEDKLFLSMFISIQYWRLPTNKAKINELINTGSFSTIRSSVINNETGEKVSNDEAKKLYDRLANDDFFAKAYPLLIGMTKHMEKDGYDDLDDWHFYFQEPGFHLTSDNPMLYIKEPTPDTIFKDFILPLSPGVLLISSKNPPNEISAFLSNALNILQICDSNQFVAGQNKGYLEIVSEQYKDNFADKSIESVKKMVLGELFPS